MKEQACEHCGKSYTPRHWYQRYCRPYCRLLAFRKRKRPEGQKEQR